MALTAAALTLTACGSTATSKGTPKAGERGSAKLVERSPLTGLVLANGLPKNPVFVVKVENTDGGQPQYGLNKADLVFEELVEGGLTRLAALYYSNLPTKVGHVRSTRATDIGIALPVGGQVVASGGASPTYRLLKNAGVTIFSEDHGAPGFSSDFSKVRPYNRLVNLQTIARAATAGPVPGNYLPWVTKAAAAAPASASASPGAAATAAPRKATSANVGFSGSTHTRWAFRGNKWHRVNGHAASGQDFAADTLLVLFARVGDAGYTDPAGNPVPETIFDGSGRAVIMHGGTAIEATWFKSARGSQITFKDKAGHTIGIDPGHVWIELAPNGSGSVSYH